MRRSDVARFACLLAVGSTLANCGPDSAKDEPLICDCMPLFGHASEANRLGPLICSSPDLSVERDLTLAVESCFCATQQCTDLKAEAPASSRDLSVISVTAKDGSTLGNETLDANSDFVVRIRYAPTTLTSNPTEGEGRTITITGTCTYQPATGNPVPVRVLSVPAGSCPVQ